MNIYILTIGSCIIILFCITIISATFISGLRKKINTNEPGKEIPIWKVKWISHKGDYNSDKEYNFKSFSSEELANNFKTELKRAAELLKYDVSLEIRITKE